MVLKQSSQLANKLGGVTVGSIMNSLLWLDLLLGILWLAVVYVPSAHVALVFIECFLGVSIVSTIFAFGYFAVTDPDRLQSEKHRYQVMQMQQQNRAPIVIEATAVTNPALDNEALERLPRSSDLTATEGGSR